MSVCRIAVSDVLTPFFRRAALSRRFRRMTETEQKWQDRVRGWRESGQSAEVFAQTHGFSAGGLRHWAYKLKVRGIATGAGTTAKSDAVAPAKRKAAHRVRVARVERVQAPASMTALTVEIGAARVRVPAGIDAALLRTTIGALLDLAAVDGGTR
jgi:hypothetical protein